MVTRESSLPNARAGRWPVVVLGLSFAAGAPAQPNFAHDIAPIVYHSCSPCHRPGEAGPFPLLTYDDVKKRSAQIAAVTRSRYMPPWLPEHGYGEFADERRLTDEQIRTIAKWVEEGAPEGPVSAIPPTPEFTEGWQLGAPDLVLQAASPISLPASGADVFWNFIFTPAVKTTRYVRAIEIRPGDKRLVHHANLLVDRTASSRLQEVAPGQGFPGMDLNLVRSPFDPDGHFLFWKPGSAPYVEPDGLAWRLDPGNLLVLNAHLQPSGKPEQVQPSIGLYFTDKRQTQFPLLIQLENDNALDIPAGNRDFLIADDFQLPMDVDVLAVYPHAHYLGRRLEAYATLPGGGRKWLIRILEWNQNWQAVFYYREPVMLPKGAVISMRYHYDNSDANVRNPNHPPKLVQAGNRATDEMGHLWLQVLPHGGGDRRRTLQEAVMRHRLDKNPGDFEASLNLGALLLSRLDAQGAARMLRAAVAAEPQRADARNMLGAALARLGRAQEAIQQFRLALETRPDFANARLNLANALAKAGNLDEAIENFRQVAALYPNDAVAKGRLATALDERGALLMRQGKFAQALEQFDQALAADPSDETARANREEALRRQELSGNH
jgi:Flp pilus assembly protein TadD/mono/diheme cytochrome c family protein